MKRNIASALNDTYVPYTYVMLYSLFENNRDADFCVYLLESDLKEESKDRLDRLAETYGNEMVFVKMDPSSFDRRFLATHHWPMETCFRLQMNDVLPEDINRILYLDGDMIVNRDITSFYDTAFAEGKHLIVTHDMTMTPDSDATHGHLHSDLFRKMIRNNAYFNAGMILMDFAFLRAHYRFRDYADLAQSLDYEIFAPDQDLLNYMHKEETQYVDALRYDLFACNAFVYGLDYDAVKEKTSIIHFVGEKPWSGGSHFHYDIEHLWWDYALKTVYADFFTDKFVRETMGESEFYRAIEQAEKMNESLSGEKCEGRPRFVKPKDEDRIQFIRTVIADRRTEAYVDRLHRENDRLQADVQDAMAQFQKMQERFKDLF